MSPARAALIRELKPFQGRAEGDWFIARTGYTGEDGLEIMLPAAEAPGFLNELVGAGISPAGLGARDTLRPGGRAQSLRPGHGRKRFPACRQHGLDRSLGAGCAGLRRPPRAGSAEGRQRPAKLVGLVLEERGVLRAHQVVRVAGIGEGEITSGSFRLP